MNLHEQLADNLFHANHRTKMVSLYGYTEAMRVTVDDLCHTHIMSLVEPEEHDCTLMLKGYCRGCEAIREALQ